VKVAALDLRKEDFPKLEGDKLDDFLRALNGFSTSVAGSISGGLTFKDNVKAFVKDVTVSGGAASTAVAASDGFASATVDVTAGGPGTVAIVGSAHNVSGVAIQQLTAPINPYHVVRFTFSAAMPDTNYVVPEPSHEYTAGVGGLYMLSRNFNITTKATTHFDVGWGSPVTPAYTHIDEATHRFGVLAYRHATGSGTASTSAFPISFKNELGGTPSHVVVTRAVSLAGSTETPVSLGSPAWALSRDQIVLHSLSNVLEGTTYRVRLLVVAE
jgi:hypothetical protein